MLFRRFALCLAICATTLVGPLEATGEDVPPTEIRESFLNAYDAFYEACRTPDDPAQAFRMWKTGLINLFLTRTRCRDEDPFAHREWLRKGGAPLGYLATYDIDVPSHRRLVGHPDTKNLRDLWLFCAERFAPWGLDLTMRMLGKGRIDADRFDMRVLDCPAEGSRSAALEIPFSESTLYEGPFGEAPLSTAIWGRQAAAVAKAAGVDPARATVRVALRLYAPRIMTQSWPEWALDWTDKGLTYGPALWGLGKVAFYGETAGVGLAVDVFLAGLDYAKDWYREHARSDGATWARIEIANQSVGLSLSGSVGYQAQKGFFGSEGIPSVAGSKRDVMKGLLGYAVALARVEMGVGHLEEVRRMSTVSGYGPGRAPPMTVDVVVAGPPSDERPDAYPVMRFAGTTLRVDHDALFGASPAEAAKNFRDGQLAQKTFPSRVPLEPVRGITAFTVDAQPDRQTIRWTWSRKILELLAQEAGRPAADWDDIASSDLGLEMEIVATGPDGKAERHVLPGFAHAVKNGQRECQVILYGAGEGRGAGLDTLRRMGFPVAELQELRRRYALLVRRSGGRTLFDQTIAFDGAVEGQKVTMRTDRAEHEIHLGTLPLEKSAGYPAVWSRMSVPCKYRISGSLTNSGDFDSDFDLEFNSEDVAWTGHRVTVAGRVPARGERCTVEVGKDAVSLALVEFTSGREAPGTKTSNRFAFKDLPRRYTVDLGPKVGQVFMYWAKGQDLAALAVARESIGRYEATERDPESGKPVPVVVDSRLVGVNWSGAEVLVMLGTTTMKELRERVQRGEITPEDQGEIERRYQQQVEDALAKFKADTGGIPRLEPR